LTKVLIDSISKSYSFAIYFKNAKVQGQGQLKYCWPTCH